MTRLKVDLIVWTCRSFDRADAMSGRGEMVGDPADAAAGDVEVAERAATDDGAFADAVAPVAERSDAIDEPTVEEASRETWRSLGRDDETRKGLRAIISFSIR